MDVSFQLIPQLVAESGKEWPSRLGVWRRNDDPHRTTLAENVLDVEYLTETVLHDLRNGKTEGD